jgi:hypothetical protein
VVLTRYCHFFVFIFAVHFIASVLLTISKIEDFEKCMLAEWEANADIFCGYFYLVVRTILTIGFCDILRISLREVILAVVLEMSGVPLQWVKNWNLVAVLLDTDLMEYTRQSKVIPGCVRRRSEGTGRVRTVPMGVDAGTSNMRTVLQNLPPSLRRSIQF